MIVRKLRLQRAWSQEQLAQLSGLNIRTIQRIERGQNAGLESLKSLAAVFEVELSDLQQETKMNNTTISEEEKYAIERVQDIKGFYTHAINYVIVLSILFVINFITSPEYIWALWASLGWGIGLISHGLSVFEVYNFFGPEWEKRQVEKRLGKKF